MKIAYACISQQEDYWMGLIQTFTMDTKCEMPEEDLKNLIVLFCTTPKMQQFGL